MPHKIIKTLTICAVLSLLLVGLAIAQPQAPVTWGEARWFGIGCESFGQSLCAMGDTMVVVDQECDSGVTVRPWHPVVTSSFDGGGTWRPWQRFMNDSVRADGGALLVQASSTTGGVLAYVWDVDRMRYWVLRSEDGGVTWTQPRFRRQRAFISGFASGHEVFCIESHMTGETTGVYEVARSMDEGATWSIEHELTTVPTGFGDNKVAFTQGHIVIAGSRETNGNFDTHYFYSNSSRTADHWPDFQEFPGQRLLGELAWGTIAGDTSSETAIMVTVWYPNAGWGQNLYVHRTLDGGDTWEEPHMLTDRGDGWAEPDIFCRGKLWGVAWHEIDAENPALSGIHCRISANHGKDWYPEQLSTSPVYGVVYTGGQFTGNKVRLYWEGFAETELTFRDYGTVTGTLEPDTILPQVRVSISYQDTLRSGDTARFEAIASDNDTLSEVRLLIADSSAQQTIVLPRVAGNQYTGQFVVSHPGLYLYRAEAEDFWENVASDPDTGWRSLVVESSESHDPFVVSPLALSLSLFPNPFNSATRISFNLPAANRIKLSVFDVLGRRVATVAEGWFEAGNHGVLFQSDGLPSGVYVARLDWKERHVSQKLVLVR
jgi:hypothetical protein